MRVYQTLDRWGLQVDHQGRLLIAGHAAVDLAAEYGTPLHVVNAERLEQSAAAFLLAAAAAYPGSVTMHYPFKCNAVPGVVEIVRRAGFRAEVMTPFELHLALQLGFQSNEIIVNGPCKTDEFLRQCIAATVRFIVVDSEHELTALAAVAQQEQRAVDILVRVNPNYVPRGMHRGSATGSRRCAFGFDLEGGEVTRVLACLSRQHRIRFHGFHFHLGTGIRHPRDYANALRILPVLIAQAASHSLEVRVLDVGGGMAAPTTRAFTTTEMLLYQGFGRLPPARSASGDVAYVDFARAISQSVLRHCSHAKLPELIYEPGRCIVSPNQLLLLTVHRVKERPGIGKWLITDGGLGTVTLPTYYEYHEVFVCNDVKRPRTERVNIIGPACFAGDIVYQHKDMPSVQAGEVLAIMDTGAYFTALESSFGFARPAIAAVHRHGWRLLRRREIFEDMTARDCCAGPSVEKGKTP